MWRVVLVAGGTMLLSLALGCETSRSVDLSTPAPARLSLAERLSPAAATTQPDAGQRGRKSATATSPVQSREFRPEPDAEQELKVPAADDPAGTVVDGFIIDGLVDVASAGPAAATRRGVVMINRRNHLHLAQLRQARYSSQPSKTRLTSLPDSAGPFPLARAPAIRGGYAYWVSRGSLLRQNLSNAGKAELPMVLTDDARVGTRVAVPGGQPSYARGLPAVAAYIAKAGKSGGPLSAKLWQLDAGKSVNLTLEGASATSVSLIATAGGMAAITLEGRTGMSSLHVRLLSRGKSSAARLSLGADEVIWVGGASGPLSEFVALGLEGGTLEGLLAAPRDMTHFGLLDLQLAIERHHQPAETRSHWMTYLNGIEPAPSAAIELCGRTMLLVAQPNARRAHSLQRLLWIERGSTIPSQGVVLAQARSFFDVSVAPMGSGALVVYVADQRTWARTIRCLR